jgi:hypothetical protein
MQFIHEVAAQAPHLVKSVRKRSGIVQALYCLGGTL